MCLSNVSGIKTFSIESGLNYTQRNYQLIINNNTINLEEFTVFGVRSYEIPLNLHHTGQFLVKLSSAQWQDIKHGEKIKAQKEKVKILKKRHDSYGPEVNAKVSEANRLEKENKYM